MLSQKMIWVLILDALEHDLQDKPLVVPLGFHNDRMLTKCWWRYPVNISTGHIEIRISTGFVRERNFPLVTANNNNKFMVRLFKCI